MRFMCHATSSEIDFRKIRSCYASSYGRLHIFISQRQEEKANTKAKVMKEGKSNQGLGEHSLETTKMENFI